jgi:hypothetical protein
MSQSEAALLTSAVSDSILTTGELPLFTMLLSQTNVATCPIRLPPAVGFVEKRIFLGNRLAFSNAVLPLTPVHVSAAKKCLVVTHLRFGPTRPLGFPCSSSVLTPNESRHSEFFEIFHNVNM